MRIPLPRSQYFRPSSNRCGVHKAACKYIARVQNAQDDCFPLFNMDWWLFAGCFYQSISRHPMRQAAPLHCKDKDIVTTVRACRTAL